MEEIIQIKHNHLDKTTPQVSELFQDACTIIEQARVYAYHAVNETLIKRNWLLGLRIQHEVLKDQRAEYGEQVIKTLAKGLMEKYGKGFTWRNLYNYLDFYQKHQDFFLWGNSISADDILHSLRGKSLDSDSSDILHSLRAKMPIRINWTHYRIILQEPTAEGRAWYEEEAAREMWSTRALQRNVSSQ